MQHQNPKTRTSGPLQSYQSPPNLSLADFDLVAGVNTKPLCHVQKAFSISCLVSVLVLGDHARRPHTIFSDYCPIVPD